MDHDFVVPRHRRPPRRRPRPGARALRDHRWTWLALGALLLLAPALLRAQGLRSTVASVSLVAVKPDPDAGPGTVVDLVVPVTPGRAGERVGVRLEDPGAPPIHVRSLTGRLERLGTATVAVAPGPLALRTVGAAPGARWRLVVQHVGPDGQVREERVEVGPAQR